MTLDEPVPLGEPERDDSARGVTTAVDNAVLSVRNLRVDFKTDDGIVHAVDDVSFDVAANETLGIVGESGSGKSVTSLAILGLLPKHATVTGEAYIGTDNLIGMSEKNIRPLRGSTI